MQAIQTQWPSTQITWVTGKLEAKLLESIDGIDVVVFDKKQAGKAILRCGNNSKGVSLMHCCICNMR
ncbi:ADP-heptose:LPS heptosyltransferase [Vibrio maritimus]|uniref:ADP-heptose:LPS heptosyltransferase n=1 Tax=Vibrio maritimus TaxID=990268 RepID=A0A090TCD1_9VIBR|nr:ADP-heptose:LPS heptosyltransferase [Vibrio maritimus]